MKTVFSGIQPTGDIHLGNYIGAINNWVKLQKPDHKNIYCVVDLHAITTLQNPHTLRNNTLKLMAWLLACGIDPERSILFLQSTNQDHAELAWLLNCSANIGWLNRMTQFKDKAGKDKETSSVGLYVYPVLQAADILLYDTNIVPIGEDQKQHIELARDIALKFNRNYSCHAFTIPEPLIIKEQARIMSLRDSTKKMSKSDPSDNAKILFSDTEESIAQKIMKAKTDSLPMPISLIDAAERGEILNLLKIYSFCSSLSIEHILLNYQHADFSIFKKDLANLLIEIINPIRDKQLALMNNQDYLLQILNNGANKAKELSDKKIKYLKEIIGFLKN